jgi:hypothetical protein
MASFTKLASILRAGGCTMFRFGLAARRFQSHPSKLGPEGNDIEDMLDPESAVWRGRILEAAGSSFLERV